MRKNGVSKVAFDIEDVSICLSTATKNLRIVQDAIHMELVAWEKSQAFLGTDYLRDCCDAMFTTIWQLDRIQDELDAIIDAACTKGDQQ